MRPLERHGPITPTPEKGTTHVSGANALHRSLDWDSATLRRLAEDLFDERRAPREYAPNEVRAAVRSLDPDALAAADVQAFVRAEQARPRRAR